MPRRLDGMRGRRSFSRVSVFCCCSHQLEAIHGFTVLSCSFDTTAAPTYPWYLRSTINIKQVWIVVSWLLIAGTPLLLGKTRPNPTREVILGRVPHSFILKHVLKEESANIATVPIYALCTKCCANLKICTACILALRLICRPQSRNNVGSDNYRRRYYFIYIMYYIVQRTQLHLR